MGRMTANSEWALIVAGVMMSLAVWVFPLVLIATLILAIFSKTRLVGGLILYIFSFLVGAATWFFGAAATFTSFGWFGLIIGLIFMGIGVVPLGIIGGFIYLDPGFAIGVIIMLVLTFAFRTVGREALDVADEVLLDVVGVTLELFEVEGGVVVKALACGLVQPLPQGFALDPCHPCA